MHCDFYLNLTRRVNNSVFLSGGVWDSAVCFGAVCVDSFKCKILCQRFLLSDIYSDIYEYKWTVPLIFSPYVTAVVSSLLSLHHLDICMLNSISFKITVHNRAFNSFLDI